MLKISTDYFVPLALQRLTAGTDEEIKETVELLLLYRQMYRVPRSTRLAISSRLTLLLKHPDATIRYWSARAVGEYDCPEALPFLKEALLSEINPSVRGWMQGAAAHLSKVPIDQLRRDLQSPDPETRSLAAQTLFFNPEVEARNLIAASMNEDDKSVMSWKLLALPGPFHMRSRSALVYPTAGLALGDFSSPRSVMSIDLLRNLVQSGDDQVAEYSIWNAALDRLGALAPIIRDMAMPGGHANPRVREWAYKFLGFVPNRNDLLLLKSVLDLEIDPKVRQGIVFAVGRIGGAEALEYLVEVLSRDSDDDVRRWAARAMLGGRIPWRDAESNLIAVVEVGNSDAVIREVLSVLEKKNSTALLSKLPLVEERSRSQGFALVSLLLSVASDRMDLGAKDKLMKMLSGEEVSPPEIMAVAFAMAEDYGIASRIMAALPVLSVELDSYRQGLNLLFEAAAVSEKDLPLCRKILRDALDLLRSVRQKLSDADQGGLVAGQNLNPLFAFSQFYEEISLSYRDMIEGVENRLQGNFEGAVDRFERAAIIYRLHESDQALPSTERNLCSSVKLWLFFQVELTKVVREAEFSRPLLLKALSFLETATLRAKDALRLSLSGRLNGMMLEATEVIEAGSRSLIFDRTAKVNQVVLSIPVALDAPFSAPSAIKINILGAIGSLEGVRLSLELTIEDFLLQDIHESFEVDLVFYSAHGATARKIFSSTEVGEGVSGHTVFERSLMIEAEESGEPMVEITFQPLLRVAGLELVCGTPESVEIKQEFYDGDARNVAELRNSISDRFDLEELRTLCQDLDINYDDLRGEGRIAKVRELVGLLKRQNRLHELQARIRAKRGVYD